MKSMSDLKYHYGLKVRIYPDERQKHIIDKNIWVARRVYNLMVYINREIYDMERVKDAHIALYDGRLKWFKAMRNRQADLANTYAELYDPKNIDSIAVSSAKRNYQKAWQHFKKVPKSGQPHFHKRQYGGSYQTGAHYSSNKEVTPFTASVRFDLAKKVIRLPKIGDIDICGSYERIIAKKKDIRIGTVTVSRDNCGDYYASLSLASDTPFVKELPKTNSEIGIDLNTAGNFIAESNGVEIMNPKFARRGQKRLANANRVLARRKEQALAEHRPLKTAKNYQKQRLVVAKLSRKIRNRRADFNHCISKLLITKHDLIVAEQLYTTEMLGKATNLNFDLYDAGFKDFLNKMAYKAELYGKKFVMVDPKNTTQTCSNCGHVMGQDGTAKLIFNHHTNPHKAWVCPKCGARHYSDWNAAINIYRRGLEKIKNDKA